MATILDLANCDVTKNLGPSVCSVAFGTTRGAIAIPAGEVIPAASLTDATTFNAYVLGRFKLDTSARWRLLPFFTTIDDKTGDPVTEAQGNYEFTVTSKPYNWQYRMPTNDCVYRTIYALFKGKQDQWDFLFFDENNVIKGTGKLDSTGANGLGGVHMAEIFVPDPVQKTPEALDKYFIKFLIQNNQDLIAREKLINSSLNINPATMGLIDVVLAAGTTSSTATVLYVSGTFECGGTNIGDTYGSTLAAASAWSVVPAAGGAAIVPSGVAYNATLKQYALTIASTPATALIVGLAAPSVLTATPYFVYAITETRNKVTITTP